MQFTRIFESKDSLYIETPVPWREVNTVKSVMNRPSGKTVVKRLELSRDEAQDVDALIEWGERSIEWQQHKANRRAIDALSEASSSLEAVFRDPERREKLQNGILDIMMK